MDDKIKTYLGDNPPVTKERFLSELWSIRMHGNVEDAYIQVCYAINNKRTFRNEAVTFELIKSKYQDYLTQCRKEMRKAQFIKSLQSFVRDGGYNNEYDSGNDDNLNRFL